MVKRKSNYTPDRGDVIWLTFDPQAGHEQSGRRPAIVLSPLEYNRLTGLAILCPITSQIKGYPFEVALPDGFPIQGVVLSDQVKNLDWRIRQASFVAKASETVMAEIREKVVALLE